jgi:hypothetical protein
MENAFRCALEVAVYLICAAGDGQQAIPGTIGGGV